MMDLRVAIQKNNCENTVRYIRIYMYMRQKCSKGASGKLGDHLTFNTYSLWKVPTLVLTRFPACRRCVWISCCWLVVLRSMVDMNMYEKSQTTAAFLNFSNRPPGSAITAMLKFMLINQPKYFWLASQHDCFKIVIKHIKLNYWSVIGYSLSKFWWFESGFFDPGKWGV